MPICKKCFTPLFDSAKFCGQCGEATNNTQDNAPTDIEGNAPTDTDLQELYQRITQWKDESNPKKKWKLLANKQQLKQWQKYLQCNILVPHGTDFLQQSLKQQSSNQHKQRWIFITMTFILVITLPIASVTAFSAYSSTHPTPDPTMVTTLSDQGPGSLREAIEQATPGTTITFAPQLKGQTIHLSSNDLDIKHSITLRGPDDANISITSDKIGKQVKIEQGARVIFDHIAFVNSYTHKNSIVENDGTLTMDNCKVTKNSSYGIGGGGILNKGYLELNNTEISGNTASGGGGGTYNLFGTVIANNSQIMNNHAYNSGGGIYSQGGRVALSQSQVLGNTANDNFGGGIDVVNSSLDVSSNTTIFKNTSDYYGGGIAVQGSVAFISDSAIHDNTANIRGGGIVVTKDTDNNSPSLVMLRNITIPDRPNALYYIGQNTDSGKDDKKDIAGNLTPVGATLQISDDETVGPIGNPPPKNPPQDTPNFLGFVNINNFCLDQGYREGKVNEQADTNDITFTCFLSPRSEDFSGQEICQALYPAPPGTSTDQYTVVDRMPNYFDPTSLQCYKNLTPRGSIGQNEEDFGNYCRGKLGTPGLYDNKSERTTAYDWLCQPKDKTRLPSGLNVSDACNLKYHTDNAIDRLVNYNRPDGWECWAPA
jgi:predicted outer membrane repeat protein